MNPGYYLKKLSIFSLPGLPRGLRPMDGIVEGVNIVYGANASGKTSTARAILALMAGDAESGTRANAVFRAGEDEFHVNLDNQRATFFRNGASMTDKPVPLPREEKHRYMLAVHELLLDEGRDFAQKISRLSLGNYDPRAAATALGYSGNISKKNISEFRQTEAAKNEVDKIRSNQERLVLEQKKLAETKREHENALEAGRMVELLEHVVNYRLSLEDREGFERELGAFPAVMEKLRPEDHADLQNLLKRREDVREKIARASDKVQDLQARRNALGMAVDIPQNLPSELKAIHDEYREIRRSIQEKESNLAAAESELQSAASALGDGALADRLRELTVTEFEDLDRFYQEATNVLGRRHALRTRLELENTRLEAHASQGSSSELANGVEILQKWLAAEENEPAPFRPVWPFTLTTLLAIFTAVWVYYADVQGFWGLVVVVASFIWAANQGRSKSTTDRSTRERDFEELSIPPVANWTTEEVTAHLLALIKEYHKAVETENRKREAEELTSALENLERRLRQMEERKDQWISDLGIFPSMPDFEGESFAGLYWLSRNLAQWKRADQNCRSCTAAIESFQRRKDELFLRFNRLMTESGFEGAENETEVDARYQKFQEDASTLRQLESDLKNSEVILAQGEEELRTLSGQLEGILGRLEIGEDEVFRVKEWSDLLSEYGERKKKRDEAAIKAEAAREKMTAHPMYADVRGELENLDDVQLRDRLNAEKLKAERAADLNRSIIETDTKIEEQKKGNDLEKALGAEQDAISQLGLQFEKNLFSLTGHLIMNHLETELSDRNRPEVFKKANEIFVDITRGAFKLALDNDLADAEFGAIDTVKNKRLSVDELSSGTRVQLQMAVRLAFMEVNEPRYAMPLLADELLANTDDRRAEVVIESLIDIAKSGRQIFYFTAQMDEVAKWRKHLAEHSDCPSTVLELSEREWTLPDFATDIALPKWEPKGKWPAPGGRDHREYGKVLGVPSFAPLVQEVSELPLWYLIEDVDRLHELLERNIERWGQLREFLRHSNDNSIHSRFPQEQYRALAEILEKYSKLIRQGRPKPVDRSVLESVGHIVSDAFIDEVDEKLKSVDGNPEKLIAALLNKEVRNFRSSNISALEDFFRDEGYIDSRPPLTEEDIRIRMEAHISGQGILTREDATRFLSRFAPSSDG